MRVSTENCQLAGEQGIIEAVLDLPSTPCQQWFSVNCHPHPLHGGSLTNKVVYTLSRGMAGLGIPGLRFNFRGVGASKGEHDNGVGEQQDLAAAVAFMQARYPGRKFILSGFSFGAWVSAMAAQQLGPQLLISVAPPVDRFDFGAFTGPACPWHVVMGDEDELVNYTAVCDWLKGIESQPHLHTLQGAGHFFHGRLVELRETIEQILQQELTLNG